MAKKIIVPPVENTETDINVFSDKLNQILNNVKIVDNGDGTESVELDLDDRVVTFVIDQSGSMTWNDNGGFRHQIATKIIEDIEANYPGEIKYNLFQYGAIISNVLFFGLIEQDGFNPNDIDSLTALYYADDDANFAGIRVVRNIERIVDGETLTYPTSPIDGIIVTEGFVTKALDDDIEEGTTYYYSVYTVDKEGRFSRGVNVRATPRDRIIPRGVTIFDSFKKFGENPYPIIGSGVQRDENIIGLWHMNELEGYRLFDFSDTKANLTLIDEEPSWVGGKFTPAGEGAMYFNGIDDHASVDDVSDLYLDLITNHPQISVMGWVLPYKDTGIQTIISSSTDSIDSYQLFFQNKKLFFQGHDGTFIQSGSSDDDVLELNKWQHICATYDYNGGIEVINLYHNGQLLNSSTSPISLTGAVSEYRFTIGAKRTSSSTLNYFYGKITEVSVHNTVRGLDYIQAQVSVKPVIDPVTEEQYIDPITGDPVTEAIGLKGDNGDRLNVFKYTVPEDADYLGGEVLIVKNEKEIPSWELDGISIHSNTIVVAGDYFVTDADDFVLGEDYYYRIYSHNTLGNYSYSTDSPSLIFRTPTRILPEYIPDLESVLEGPSIPFGVPVTVGGTKKVGIRWRNDLITDDRIERVKIYVSTSTFPTVNPDGGSSGTLVFTGNLNDSSFVDRDLTNGIERFYTITNIDKYGRNSSTHITSSATPLASVSAEEEALIPLLEVDNLHYEIVNNEAISIVWDQPVKHIKDLTAFFGQPALLYATITDEFGQPVPDDTIVEMFIESNITRETEVDDVFTLGELATFTDEDTYSFITSNIKNGIIQATLDMTSNTDILSQITAAEFKIRVKSFIPSNSANQGQTASDGQADSNVNVSGPIGDYLNIINELIADIEGEDVTTATSTDNIFEYISQPLTISYSNPWELEIINRDDKVVEERCYYYKKDKELGVVNLTQMTETLNGSYIRSSDPYTARVKVTFQGEPVPAGTPIQVAIWDADVDLCSCATEEPDPGCYPSFSKTNASEIVTLPNSIFTTVDGIETRLSPSGETIETPISYVDVSLYPPNLPLNVILYAKGLFAGLSALKSFGVVFQNILRIDLNAQPPQADGVNIKEQQSSVYIINPDFPTNTNLYTYPKDESIVEWKIDPKFAFKETGSGLTSTLVEVDVIPRNLYSIDNVPLPNGVFSYTRTSTARNVFLGPVENRGDKITETYELSATISYQGLSSQARQEIEINHNSESLDLFGARFLMETEYGYRNSRGNRIWSDGVDYKKIYISRDPTTADYPEFLYGDLFRNCAAEEDSPVLELNTSGQEVTLRSLDEVEFVWGDVSEMMDPYTGRKYLETTDDTSISFGEAKVILDTHVDGDLESDRTTVYFRVNTFNPGSSCSRSAEPPCDDVNLRCLNLTTCQIPLGNFSISGETFLLVQGEPLKLIGGGSDESGVPPCPACFNEPLRVSTVWTKIDGEDTPKLGEFPEDAISVNSSMDIRVEVSFSGLPVPDGTPLSVVVGNNDGRTVFSPFENIVFTEIDIDGRSYADAKIIILHVPDVTSTELVNIFSIYNEVGDVDRRIGTEYNMTLTILDVPGETEPYAPPVVEPQEEKTVYSKTLERYNIDLNEWSYSTDMSVARSAAFVSSVNNKVYVSGGFINNEIVITPKFEVYDALLDTWSFAQVMPTPRFGGQTIVIDSKIYMIGGCFYDHQNQNIEVSRAVEMYDTLTEEWFELADMPIMGAGANEQLYGVAYGTAAHVILDTGSDTLNYIYILSGATEVYDGNNGIDIDMVNDRILRYCIETNSWDISTLPLFGSDLDTYQRISPLGFSEDNQITVFNGAIIDLDALQSEFIFTNEIYTITVTEDIDLTDFVPVSLIGTRPLAKYQSSLVEYFPDPSGSDRFLFVIGGASDDSLSLDIVERLDTSIQPYDYTNSELTLEPLSKGRNALGAAFAYGLVDEYGEIAPYIYVMGGKTSGNDDDVIEIGFGD